MTDPLFTEPGKYHRVIEGVEKPRTRGPRLCLEIRRSSGRNLTVLLEGVVPDVEEWHAMSIIEFDPRLAHRERFAAAIDHPKRPARSTRR